MPRMHQRSAERLVVQNSFDEVTDIHTGSLTSEYTDQWYWPYPNHGNAGFTLSINELSTFHHAQYQYTWSV
jgi:hypothetical protein